MIAPPRILIVDDEPRMAHAIATALERIGYECRTCGDATEALEVFRKSGADAVITDRRMPGMSGDELLSALRIYDPEIPVILVTAHADIQSAVAAMRAGAFDYVTKPFDNDELRALVARALELRKLRRENRNFRDELGARWADEIIAESDRMKAAIDLADRVAPSNATVLIEGETGTGKEVIARRLHFSSPRVGGPFVAVNCSALAESVLESELFGHEKGAFTGAGAQRRGCFERADGGTLLLDEIGEISPSFQVKLLRVLQEGEVLRVGGIEPRQVDIRLVVATNRNLATEVREGRFREDLFFRLNVVPIVLSPLRDRRQDILPLAHYFLQRHTREGGRVLELSPQTERVLLDHAWPGNVRELENAIERASLLSHEPVLQPEDFSLGILTSSKESSGENLQVAIDLATREHVQRVLDSSANHRAEAARRLGVDRTTLYRLIKRLGL